MPPDAERPDPISAEDRAPEASARRRFPWLELLIPAVLIGLGLLASHIYFHRNDWMMEPLGFAQEAITVSVERGMSARRIGQVLVEAGVMPSQQRFLAVVDFADASDRLRAGTYRITPDLTPLELVTLLQSPSAGGVRVTLIEGWTTEQMVQALVDAGLLTDVRAFYRALEDHPRLAQWAAEREGHEGYLWPDTYLFVPGMTPADLVDELVSGFDDALDVEAFAASAEAQGLSLEEAVILASVVEREARTDDERATIAAVFLNRLARDMKLESCATVHYAIGDWSRPLTVADTEIDHPFNTYENPGLPPAAICNPGLASLMAVVSPEETDHLFFVYDENLGRHRFSRTFAEHQRAIRATRGG